MAEIDYSVVIRTLGTAGEKYHKLFVMRNGKAKIRAGDGHSRKFLEDMLEFDVIRFQELTPRGRVVKEVTNFYGSAFRLTYGVLLLYFAGFYDDFAAHLVFFSSGLERDLGYGCDGGECFAPESEREYLFEVFLRLDFRRGVSLETGQGIVGGHSATIVDYLNESTPGVLYYKANLFRSCVYRIFQQFLNHRGRSLYDLSGSYHIR